MRRPFAALGEGFTSLEGISYWSAEEYEFFFDAERFFKKLRRQREPALFFITFEGGLPFLKLPPARGKVPPYGIVRLKPLKKAPPAGERPKAVRVGSSMKREDYLRAVERVKKLIEAGDVYQVNLTVRFDYAFWGDTFRLWRGFYELQPVSFAAYLELPSFRILSGSMELFLKKEGKKLTSSPIKGTLGADGDPKKLLTDQKELSENLMITDMVRNDLASVSKPGSVRVEKLFKVESYKTLHQLVSTVSALTEEDLEEILKRTFPPASVTGAPKRRAVEIIREIEPHAREIYCGTVGFLKGGGDFSASVAIRTALFLRGRLSYYAGGGIVYDSDPQKEWEEVLLKTEAFERALQNAP